MGLARTRSLDRHWKAAPTRWSAELDFPAPGGPASTAVRGLRDTAEAWSRTWPRRSTTLAKQLLTRLIPWFRFARMSPAANAPPGQSPINTPVTRLRTRRPPGTSRVASLGRRPPVRGTSMNSPSIGAGPWMRLTSASGVASPPPTYGRKYDAWRPCTARSLVLTRSGTPANDSERVWGAETPSIRDRGLIGPLARIAAARGGPAWAPRPRRSHSAVHEIPRTRSPRAR